MNQPKVKSKTEIKSYSRKLLAQRLGMESESVPVVYQAQPEEDDEGGLDIGKFFASVKRRTFIVATVAIAVAAAAVTQALVSAPSYQGKFQLLIKPATVEDKLSSSPLSDQKETADPNQTVLQILQSPKLLTPIYKQVEARYPSNKVPNISFNLIQKTNIVEISYQDPNPAKVEFVLDLLAKAYLVYSLEDRRTDVRQGVEFVEGQLPKLRLQVKTVQDQLQNFRQKYDLIDPTTQGQQLATQLDGVVAQRRDTQTQLAKLRALYTSLQNQLQLQSREATAATALSESPRYQNLLNQLQQVQTQIAVQSVHYREDSPQIQSLRVQEKNLLPLVEQERKNLLGKNLLGTTTKVTALASPSSLRASQTQQFFDTANQIQSLEAQSKALAKAEDILREQVREFPLIVRQNDDLQQQLTVAKDSLNQFLAKREALRIDLAQKQVPWQLLTPPTDPLPNEADVRLNLILGATLGLILGIGVALLIDKFNNLLYSPEDVKDTTALPLVGEIPFKQESQQLTVAAGVAGLIQLLGRKLKPGKRQQQFQPQNTADFWESLRSLHTNIRFISFNAPVRSLAVISAASEDGRSTIAMHMAQTAAIMGQRVLLVDADLRNPKLHQMLGLSNAKGLSNVIAAEVDYQEAIHQVNYLSGKAENEASVEPSMRIEPAWEGSLFVLTAGQIPPNPTNLLSSQKMQNLARQFEAAFDLVIYDTSPLIGLADSSLVAANADASILVVGLGKTHRWALEKALEQLKIAKTPVLGVVVNGVTSYTSA